MVFVLFVCVKFLRKEKKKKKKKIRLEIALITSFVLLLSLLLEGHYFISRFGKIETVLAVL